MKAGARNRAHAQRDRLLKFRAGHPVTEIEVAGVRWEYMASGLRDETLLLLHGGLRVAETAFAYVELFEDTYRVLVPTYPPVMHIDDILAGLAAMLEAEQVPSAHVLGQSYGGFVAQAFARRNPERVQRLVLSSTGPLSALTNFQRFQFALGRQLFRLPERWLLGIYKRALSSILSVATDEREFWQAYLDEIFARPGSKAEVLSTYLTTEDALSTYGLPAGQPSDWTGAVLIIGGTGDRASTEADRRRLNALYPQARVILIAEGGHTVALRKPKEYAAAVKEFLRG